jgi:hypothetical protein
VLVEIEVCEQFSYNSRSESAGHLCSAELLAVPESWHVHFRRPQFLGRHMLWLGKLQDNTKPQLCASQRNRTTTTSDDMSSAHHVLQLRPL